MITLVLFSLFFLFVVVATIIHLSFSFFTASFYTLPCISDFIIDILVGCSQSDIRNSALEQFFILSQTTLSSDTGQQTPHQFMLKVLLKAYLPFWVSSTQTRGASHR